MRTEKGRGREHLAPSGALLEAVTDLLGRLAHSQVLAHVAALPVTLLQLHAQREVLSQRPGGRPAALLERIGADQEVGAFMRHQAHVSKVSAPMSHRC